MGDVLRFERRSSYTGKVIPCRDCPFPAVVIVFPRIDHRRRKPWPMSYGLCADHAATGTETTDAKTPPQPEGHGGAATT